jgi:hypothetical protein
MGYAPIRALFKVLSLYLEARIRIRIRIKVKGRIRIRIRIKVKGRIRFRIKVMRIRNTVYHSMDQDPLYYSLFHQNIL